MERIVIRAIDTHCHVQLPQYDADRDEVIARTLAAGVAMLCIGVDEESSRRALDLARRYEGLWCSVGLHPNDNLEEEYSNDTYHDLAKDPKVVAIGEIGLDYFRTTDERLRNRQRERFLQQLSLAKAVGKPVVIHCRDAHADMVNILRDAGVIGVVHSFNGTVDEMRTYLSYGMYIGMNAIVTFSDSYDAIVREVPLDRLLLETDAPYLTPAPARGARNEPVNILSVASHIAGVKGITTNEVLSATTANARLLLYIEI